MQKANYLSTATASGGSGKYPLSTQGLDFIQQQIMLLQSLGFIGGTKYILKEPDGVSSGLVFIDGELLTLAARPVRSAKISFIVVTTTKENIKADGETYNEARTYRTAAYSPAMPVGGESYPLRNFSSLTTNQTLAELCRQMPQTVLNYLQDILAEKLPLLHREGVTMVQLDALKDPCIMSCTKSAKIGGFTEYGLEVIPCGDGKVVQTLIFYNGVTMSRVFDGVAWRTGFRDTETKNLNIEVKTVSGTVYIRHGELPPSASIILLRKKKRSKWRRTGGPKSYTHNKGIREKRQPKRQYVHYRGIVLDAGTPNNWYVPRCKAVDEVSLSGSLIGKELGGCCRPLVNQITSGVLGEERYRVAGVRNLVTNRKMKHTQTSAYCEMGIRVMLGDNGKVGGDILRFKYHLRRKKVKTESVTPEGKPIYKYVFYRSFSFE